VSHNLVVALIVETASTLGAIAALPVGYRGFTVVDKRLGSPESSLIAASASMDRRFDLLHADMQDLNKRMRAVAIDVALVKEKLRRKP